MLTPFSLILVIIENVRNNRYVWEIKLADAAILEMDFYAYFKGRR